MIPLPRALLKFLSSLGYNRNRGATSASLSEPVGLEARRTAFKKVGAISLAVGLPAVAGTQVTSPAKGQTDLSFSGSEVRSLRDWNAKAGTGDDDTQTIESALRECAGKGWRLRIPAGYTFRYSGKGINPDTGYLSIIGDGAGLSNILITGDSYLIDTERPLLQAELRGFTVSGGKGLFRSRFKGNNVSGSKRFSDLAIIAFTECAIQANGSDEPYYIIEDCQFEGRDSKGTIGVALGSGADMAMIRRNQFLKARIGVKACKGAQNIRVEDNDFVQFDRPGVEFSRAFIWVVPDISATTGGGKIEGNKFGAENQQSSDAVILIAAEANGTFNGDRLPAYVEADGMVVGLNVSRNNIDRSSASTEQSAVVTSYADDLRAHSYIDNFHAGTPLRYVCYKALYKAKLSYLNTDNVAAYFNSNSGGMTGVPLRPSNDPAWGSLVADVHGVQITDAAAQNFAGGGASRTGYVDLMADIVDVRSLVLGGGATRAQSTSKNERDFVFHFPIGGSVSAVLTGVEPGRRAWIEFDAWIEGSGNGEAQVLNVDVAGPGPTGFHCRRQVLIAATRRTVVIPLVFRDTSRKITLILSSQNKEGVIGMNRVAAYHSAERVPHGLSIFDRLKLARIPEKADGLEAGEVWCDRANGNVLRIV